MTLIDRNLVYTNTRKCSQKDVLHAIVEDAHTLNYINDKEAFLEAILEREAIMPTSVGFQVAIPHGRSKAVNEAFVAFMKTDATFEWDHKNSEKVDLIFLIGVPEENKDNLHLKCLSMISRKLMQDEFREALRNAENEDVAFEMLNEINKQIKGEE